MDDCHYWQGSRKAVDEYFSSRGGNAPLWNNLEQWSSPDSARIENLCAGIDARPSCLAARVKWNNHSLEGPAQDCLLMAFQHHCNLVE